MSRIRGRDTKPELMLRRELFARGLRYRLHDKGLPGRPDLVVTSRRAVIFIHGCFWHGHACPRGVTPGTNTAFWVEKIRRNRERDQAALSKLLVDEWRVLTVWECAIVGPARRGLPDLGQCVISWLDHGSRELTISGAWSAD
ncbi:very short patch repair endonuclease [Mesorhizobium sp. M0848]